MYWCVFYYVRLLKRNAAALGLATLLTSKCCVQPAYVFPLRLSNNQTLFIYMGDRWNYQGIGSVSAHPNTKHLYSSRHENVSIMAKCIDWSNMLLINTSFTLSYWMTNMQVIRNAQYRQCFSHITWNIIWPAGQILVEMRHPDTCSMLCNISTACLPGWTSHVCMATPGRKGGWRFWACLSVCVESKWFYPETTELKPEAPQVDAQCMSQKRIANTRQLIIPRLRDLNKISLFWVNLYLWFTADWLTFLE